MNQSLPAAVAVHDHQVHLGGVVLYDWAEDTPEENLSAGGRPRGQAVPQALASAARADPGPSPTAGLHYEDAAPRRSAEVTLERELRAVRREVQTEDCAGASGEPMESPSRRRDREDLRGLVPPGEALEGDRAVLPGVGRLCRRRYNARRSGCHRAEHEGRVPGGECLSHGSSLWGDVQHRRYDATRGGTSGQALVVARANPESGPSRREG